MQFGDEKFVQARRIHYAGDDADDSEAQVGPKLTRQRTDGSQMSIHSVYSTSGRNRRASIQPEAAIPIQFRTLSFNIEESKGKELAEAKKAKDHAATELSDLDWHTISTTELYNRLSTSRAQGLSDDQVSKRLIEYGRNIPSKPESRLLQQIFGYFFGGFGTILFVASILVFISWKPLGEPNPAIANLALGIVLAVVFVVQATFNAWQDFSSSRVMASITTMLPDNCLVLRDGKQVEIQATEMVPGDVVYIKSGNKLAADLRFVEVSSDAKFDRSILTGESMPVAGTVDSTDDNYLETGCIGLQGTHCISGSGLGVVVATADATVFGRIAKLTNKPNTESTNLQKEIMRFVFLICSIMAFFVVMVLILWGAWLRKSHPSWINVPTLIVDCVSIAVAFVPEGLPIAITTSLTITANIMRKNKILCKSLKTVETLGAITVLASDKTGTLTKNQMFVTECSVGTTPMDSTSARDEMIRLLHKKTDEEGINNCIAQLRSVAGLCNAADFDAASYHLPLHERKINGDATDQAVLRFSESLGPVADLRLMWKKTFDLAFNSKNKFMIRTMTLVEDAGLQLALPSLEAASFQPDDSLLLIKGGPDVLINRCSTYTNEDGITVPLSEVTKDAIEGIKNKWSSEGKRVILLARKIIPVKSIRSHPSSAEHEREIMEHALNDLTLVGLVGIVDPPRDEIPEVVSILRRAGIRIFMVTGDFALTAQAIAAECGIITNLPHNVDSVASLPRDVAVVIPDEKLMGIDPETAERPITSIVLSGPELIALNDNQWERLCLYDEIVFARTTPEQKLRIVREFQKREHVVGMTGDGVNDAPSLKAADIGIALGSGSDIAIEAADMVLLDSFSAIVEAVLYGRVVFDNLKKTIIYLLPAGSFSEFFPVATNVAFGLPQVLSSFLMIVICCFTDCAAATTLAFEKPESDVLLRKPRNLTKDHLVDWKLIFQAFGIIGVIEASTSFAMSYWYLTRQGVPFSALWFQFGELPANLDPDYVAAKINTASSIYFINLVVMQWFNLMAVRTRRLSIFQQPPAFNKATQNLYLFPAIVFALLMAFLFLYIPQLQRVINTSDVPVEHWFLPVAFGLGILFLDEARKYGVRNWPNGVLAKIAW